MNESERRFGIALRIHGGSLVQHRDYPLIEEGAGVHDEFRRYRYRVFDLVTCGRRSFKEEKREDSMASKVEGSVTEKKIPICSKVIYIYL